MIKMIEKKIVSLLIEKNVIPEVEEIEIIKSLKEKQKEELKKILENLPLKDFESIKKNLKEFFKIFNYNIDEKKYYEIKKKLIVKYGKNLFENYTTFFLEEAKKTEETKLEKNKEEKERKTIAEEQTKKTSKETITEKTKTTPITKTSQPIQTAEKTESNEKKLNTIIIDEKLKELPKENEDYKIIFEYKEFIKKRSVQDFTLMFNKRLEQISNILKNRTELANALPSRILLQNNKGEKHSFIGMVNDIQETKNGHYIITVEDKYNQIKMFISKNNKELIEKAKEITFDEVLGFRGTLGEGLFYVDDIIWPDIPLDRQIKYSNEDINAVFISDLQFGSIDFLKEEFERFLEWINGNTEDEELNNLAKKTKYLFIVGDLVDGVGIYPGQDEELVYKDIYEQFQKLAELLNKVPKNIMIFAIPGNHDPVRLAEPQPAINRRIIKPLLELKNFRMLTNPSIVRIGMNEKFSGIDVLLYHGFSYDYYTQNIDLIRLKGGYDAPLEIMKYLLKRRHLAPTHTSTVYVPDPRKDHLVIETIPDIFVSGHIHRARAGNYKSVTLIQSSTWQGMTKFMEKTGHIPEPAKAFVVNLKTRNVKELDFSQ